MRSSTGQRLVAGRATRGAGAARGRSRVPKCSRQAAAIIAAVRAEGDAAVRRFTEQFGGAALGRSARRAGEFREARASLTAEQIAALERAVANVTRFHEAQISRAAVGRNHAGRASASASRGPSAASASTCPRAPRRCPPPPSCWPCRRASRAARRAPLPVRPDPTAKLHAAVLVAAELCGIDTVYKMGGAQAIAALAFGTESVRKVDKIFGPGSAWVTAAKQIVAADPAGAAIDLPAGPSEVLVIADESANPKFVAADLLAQAEHDTIAQVDPGDDFARPCARQSTHEVDAADARAAAGATSSTQSMAQQPLHRRAGPRRPRSQCRTNMRPSTSSSRRAIRARCCAGVECAGSVFLGAWSPESMGDYCSGTNHVLPTFGYARSLQRSFIARLSEANHRAGTQRRRDCARSAPRP